ncbi:MAG: RdgB/HAM1 family non-canonical purine NTP pyrophosphatase [Cyclobacteriaceae bacterium]
MKICFASQNQNKVREISQLAGDGIEIFGLKELGFADEIAETGSTMEENSRIKARFIYDKFNVPVFADDSGLEVHALNGQPGVYSARYAGPEKDDQKNIDLLLANLSGREDRFAQFKTVITFIDSNGGEQQFEGVAKGKIIDTQKGGNGFGYDPIFVPEGHALTFAEMTFGQKNELSHRAKAFNQLLSYLNELK